MEALSTHYGDTVGNRAAAPFTVYQDLHGRGAAGTINVTPFIPLQPGNEAGLVKSECTVARATPSGRVFDVIVALLAILVFLPFLILAAIAIKLSAPGPVLFVQRRVGCDGKLFPCLKFRSMVVNSQEVLNAVLESSPEARIEWERDQKLRSDPRITPIGAILRKSSLDELPQLFNILVGHMSIVGPRPIIEAEIPRYGQRFNAYCSVRPGLTGLWQVSGRNEVSYEARVRLDGLYALRKSMLYDLSICLRTVPAVLGSRGVY
ncbi:MULTISPECIES: sugar transferase [unclassified Novosphingobium]|uniref:sugar transferase n=1 Tax=unclassified Novosphingobium TaxID=2644732 RepID=UPI00135C69B5|nr:MULTISPECIES: sugar transferase [unclassified Novosphingobium]